ncbi:MAG: hypothetical protein WBF42_19785 [Terracidiphilus sp.]
MYIQLLIEVAAIAGLSALGLLLTLTNYKLLAQVTALSGGEFESTPPGGDVTRLLRMHREYGRLFPEGKLVTRIRLMIALLFLCMLVASVAVRGF